MPIKLTESGCSTELEINASKREGNLPSDTLLVAQSLLGYQIPVGGEELPLSKAKISPTSSFPAPKATQSTFNKFVWSLS